MTRDKSGQMIGTSSRFAAAVKKIKKNFNVNIFFADILERKNIPKWKINNYWFPD